VAHERAQMMGDVMVESAREPAYKRVARRIIGRGREDVIHAVVELVAVQRKMRAVDRMRRLEYQRYAQTNDQVDQHERPDNQQRRSPQHDHRQDEHVCEVESLPPKEDGVLSRRMLGTLQIVVGREEKGLKVPHENIVKREHRVKEQRIDVLKPMPARTWFVGSEPEDTASRKRVVFTVEIDAGVVPSMMQDPPHVGADSAKIEDIVQGFVYGRHRRDGVVVAVMGDVQQEECLRKAA